MRARISPDCVVDYLNRLIELDHAAIDKMFGFKTRVNGMMVSDPLAPVAPGAVLSTIGMINGMFCDVPKKEYGPIAAVHNVDCGYCGRNAEPGQVIGDTCIKCSGLLVKGQVVRFELVDEPIETR